MSRYLPVRKLARPLSELEKHDLVSKQILGRSVRGVDIPLYQVGQGRTKILAWSQMHGNESTATRATLKFVKWLLKSEQAGLLDRISLYVIFQLNPDGANVYSRYNALGVDLNRDALDLSQPESRALKSAFDAVKPDLCLNLHDQRTVYAVGDSDRPAVMSLLAPSIDSGNGLNSARQTAMQLIVGLNRGLSELIPGSIARFQDEHNPNCFGEYFIKQGVATVLFEAGHCPDDYQRHRTRKIFCKALKIICRDFATESYLQADIADYEAISYTQASMVDLIVRNVDLAVDGQPPVRQDIAVMFYEKLAEGYVNFLPLITDYGQDLQLAAHQVIELDRPVTLPYQADISNHYNFIKDDALLELIYQVIPSLIFETSRQA